MTRNVLRLLVCCAALAVTNAVSAQTTFSIVPGMGTGTHGVLFDTDSPAQGWSFGVCHSIEAWTLEDAVSGATTLTVFNGDPPDFSQINFITDTVEGEEVTIGVTVGVVISFLGMATLPPGTDHQILDLTYTFHDPAGPVEGEPCVTYSIEFCETLGSPPVASVIVIDGASVMPDFENVAFEDCPLVTPAITDMTCASPDPEQVIVSWGTTFPDLPFDYLLLHKDGVLLGLLDAAETEYVDTDVLPGETYTYTLVGVYFLPGDPTAYVEQASCSVTIVALELYGVTGLASGFFFGGDMVELDGQGFLSAETPLVTIGGIEVLDLVVVDDNTLTFTTPAYSSLGPVDIVVMNSIGSASLTDAFFYGFIRGDVDCDRSADIGDAQGMLDYLFGDGDPPCCADAADTNDDGVLDIADPINLLYFLFDAGPAIPAPFPSEYTDPLNPADVGDDPTGDGLICI